MLAHVIDGKVVSIIRPSSTNKTAGTPPAVGKYLPVIKEVDSYNPVYQAKLGPETVVEDSKVRLIYTVTDLEDPKGLVVAHLLNRVNELFSSKSNALTSLFPVNEVSTWPQQKAEAEAYLLDETAEVPFLQLVAGIRGISLEDIVLKVLTKASGFSTFVGNLLGRKQALEDLIESSAGSLTALLSIGSDELESGW